MSFEGSIGEIDLVGRLVELGREHFTGAIRFEQDGIIKIIYFKGGDVLSASTNDRKDAIDEILLRAGKVGREHIKQALAKRQESETLGDALLNLGFITRKELTWARRVQVIGILRSVRSWANGTYAIVADYLPKREEGTLFPLPQIIVEFIVTEQDRPTFDRAMDGGEAVFHKTAAFDTAFPALDLNEDAAEIVKNIDGEKSAGEIAAATGADAFNVYKLLEAMRLLGLIDKAGATSMAPSPVEAPALAAPPPQDDMSFESIGVADAADAWTATPPPPPAPEPQPELQFHTEPEPEPEPEPAPAPEPEPPMSFGDEGAKVPFALHLEPGQMQPPPPTPVIEDKAWGFDEAQIEAAERAALPHPPMTPKKRQPTMSRPMLATPAKKKGGGMRFALIMILLIAGIAIGGWLWWQGRQQTPPPAVVTRPAPRPVIQPATPAPPPVVDTASQTTGAIVPAPATTTATTATATTTTVATTTTAAPPPQKKTAVATNTAPPPTKSRLENSTQGGGRVITNVPPMSPAVTDAGREKYDAMARQYAQNPSGAYTVQFELVCQTASLARAINNGGANVWFLQTTYRGQACYRVFWGHFDSRDAAVAALNRIPAALKGSTPVVVSIPKS